MMKPDTVDIPLQKPDAIDEKKYDKPNTYEEEERESLPPEVLEDLVIRAEFINGKRPDVSTQDDNDDDNHDNDNHDNDNDDAIQKTSVASSLLSHEPTSTTSLATTSFPMLSPSASSISSNCSDTSSTRQALLEILKKKPMEDLIKYDLRKLCLSRPEEQDIYFYGTKVRAYKKVQPHSYSWGFQNILYRTTEDETVKVAEARRRAFRKEITVEWGDFPEQAIEEEPSTPLESTTTRSNQLHNVTKSHMLFTYETVFEAHRIRWKKTSIRSHDLICEIQQPEKDKWRVIAEFDSHRLGYFTYLGVFIIDKNALNVAEKPDHLEAHLIVTCCTLIDLMREVVEQAVGISKGGIVGSD
ncbi:hypothetical protein G6F56_004827 [Rhizopus delemar]|nr:hypothetical protein G6F56_004827 [Rhizopus delemar]